MSAVATQTPMGEIGPVRRLVRSLRPVAGLLRPYRALFAGGVATNLMVHVCTFGAAVVGAVLIGKALKGSTTSELWPLVWVIVILAVPIALFGWLEVVVVHVMSFRLIDDLRTQLYSGSGSCHLRISCRVALATWHGPRWPTSSFSSCSLRTWPRRSSWRS
jgi:hypothetical protein